MSDIVVAVGTHALYDPEKARADAHRHFQNQLRVGDEIVREAANLLLRAFKTSQSDVLDMVAIGHLFRSLIVAADGCLLCLESGAAEQALVHTRKSVEAGLQLQWLLRDDRESRARRFYVWHLREQRSWHLRAITGTPEHTEHVKAWEAEGDPGPELDPIANQALVDDAEALLATEANRETNAWFELAKANGSGKRMRAREPNWYTVGPGAVPSLGAMAKALGRYTDWRTTYRYLSYAVHSSSLSSSVSVQSSQLRLEHIRFPRHFSQAFSFTFLELLARCFDIARTYRPGEAPALERRARDNWLRYVASWTDVQVPDPGMPE